MGKDKSETNCLGSCVQLTNETTGTCWKFAPGALKFTSAFQIYWVSKTIIRYRYVLMHMWVIFGTRRNQWKLFAYWSELNSLYQYQYHWLNYNNILKESLLASTRNTVMYSFSYSESPVSEKFSHSLAWRKYRQNVSTNVSIIHRRNVRILTRNKILSVLYSKHLLFWNQNKRWFTGNVPVT